MLRDLPSAALPPRSDLQLNYVRSAFGYEMEGLNTHLCNVATAEPCHSDNHTPLAQVLYTLHLHPWHQAPSRLNAVRHPATATAAQGAWAAPLHHPLPWLLRLLPLLPAAASAAPAAPLLASRRTSAPHQLCCNGSVICDAPAEEPQILLHQKKTWAQKSVLPADRATKALVQ
jgi:hypothetical protein